MHSLYTAVCKRYSEIDVMSNIVCNYLSEINLFNFQKCKKAKNFEEAVSQLLQEEETNADIPTIQGGSEDVDEHQDTENMNPAEHETSSSILGRQTPPETVQSGTTVENPSVSSISSQESYRSLRRIVVQDNAGMLQQEQDEYSKIYPELPGLSSPLPLTVNDPKKSPTGSDTQIADTEYRYKSLTDIGSEEMIGENVEIISKSEPHITGLGGMGEQETEEENLSKSLTDIEKMGNTGHAKDLGSQSETHILLAGQAKADEIHNTSTISLGSSSTCDNEKFKSHSSESLGQGIAEKSASEHQNLKGSTEWKVDQETSSVDEPQDLSIGEQNVGSKSGVSLTQSIPSEEDSQRKQTLFNRETVPDNDSQLFSSGELGEYAPTSSAHFLAQSTVSKTSIEESNEGRHSVSSTKEADYVVGRLPSEDLVENGTSQSAESLTQSIALEGSHLGNVGRQNIALSDNEVASTEDNQHLSSREIAESEDVMYFNTTGTINMDQDFIQDEGRVRDVEGEDSEQLSKENNIKKSVKIEEGELQEFLPDEDTLEHHKDSTPSLDVDPGDFEMRSSATILIGSEKLDCQQNGEESADRAEESTTSLNSKMSEPATHDRTTSSTFRNDNDGLFMSTSSFDVSRGIEMNIEDDDEQEVLRQQTDEDTFPIAQDTENNSVEKESQVLEDVIDESHKVIHIQEDFTDHQDMDGRFPVKEDALQFKVLEENIEESYLVLDDQEIKKEERQTVQLPSEHVQKSSAPMSVLMPRPPTTPPKGERRKPRDSNLSTCSSISSPAGGLSFGIVESSDVDRAIDDMINNQEDEEEVQEENSDATREI